MSQDPNMNEGNAPTAPIAAVQPQPLNDQAVAATAPTDQPIDIATMDRQKTIRILAHRRMLLERMKLCRKATEARLGLYEKEGPYSAKVSEPAEDGEEFITSRKRTFPSKEMELHTYAELSKYATNYIVKKAPVKPVAPAPRNILSLRTGSSVGNKMKAAVATLTTNVGWISDTSSSSSAQPVNRNTTIAPIAPMAPPASTVQSSTKNEPSSVSADVKPLHKPLHPVNGQRAAGFPAVAGPASSSMAMPSPAPIDRKISLASAGIQLKKKISHSGKKRTGKSIRNGSSMSTSETTPAANKPLHLPGPKETTSSGPREHNGNHDPRILCPGTDRLRRKRRDLVSKLDNLMRRTYADTLANEDLSERRTPKRTQFDNNPYSNRTKTPWKSFIAADSAPCVLPLKRKTQWDYVLEEMRWLSTDYIEEHKWKRAAAKTLSSAVMTHHAEIAAKAKASPSKISKSTPSSETSKEEKPTDEVAVEIKSSRYEEESMEEESDSDSLPDERISNLEFVDPTEDDVKLSKSISATITEMVEAHWNLHALDIVPVDPNNTYTRYRNLRQNEQVDVHSDGVKASRDKSTEGANGNSTQIQQLTFNEIEERVNKCREKTTATNSKMHDNFDDFHGDMSNAIEGTELEIQENQMESLQFVEALWNDENEPLIMGSVISGAIGCGKTFSTGLLMWRRKGKGAQLLLCPAASLLRWRHELRHFKDLNVTIFDANDTSEKKPQFEMIPNSVILCDFARTAKLLSEIRPIHESFVTVIVDTRFSSFPPQSSIGKTSITSHVHQTIRGKATLQGTSPSLGDIVAEELYSSEWWNRLIEIAIREGTKCALVETSCVSDSFEFLLENDASLSDGKEKPDILASKIAFLYHTLFRSKHKTFGRRAFWWAKKYCIASKKKSDSSGHNKLDTSKGPKGILAQLIRAISFSPELTIEESTNLMTGCIPKWTLQTCPLSPTQRNAYERECVFVRGSFQHDENTAHGGLTSAKALLRLRRVCFHSNMHDFVSHAAVSALSYGRIGRQEAGRSCSQPNIAKAKSLIDGSSKLRQLLSILCKDCGFDLPAKSFLLGSKPARRGRKSSALKRKKVLVLASLPEVLLLISSFLNALGIAHELLAPPPSHTLPNQHGIDTVSSTEHTLSWIQCQQAIARFGSCPSDDSLSKSRVKLNVLVSSPNTLASTSLGLGASNAEVVISMDEDWSGRHDLSTFSVLRKNITNNSQKATGRKFIKVISEATCEESFLTYEKKARGKQSILALPLSMSSLQQTKVDFRGGVWRSSFPGVGMKLLRFVGVSLHRVFCANALRGGTLIGGPPLFLATTSCSFEDTCPYDPPQSWDKVSVFLDEQSDDDGLLNTSNDESILSSFGLIMVEVEQSSVLQSTPLLVFPRKLPDPYGEILGGAESVFSKHMCHDMCLKGIQRYISSSKARLSTSEASDLNDGIIPKKSSEINGQKEKVKKRRKNDVSSVASSENSHFRAFGNSKPEEIASSLIWYNYLPKRKPKESDQDSKSLPCTDEHRTNSYVRSYMTSKKKFDGNQGCESLVYFPPLFPGLLETRHSSEVELIQLEQSLMNRDMGLHTETKKRKISPEGNQGSNKKLRDISISTSVPDFSAAAASVTPSQPLPILPGDFNLLAVSDVDFMDGADLFDGVDGDFLPDLNITKDEELIEDIDPEVDEIDPADLEDSTQPSLDEDFGILGSGLLPPLEQSSRAARKRSGQSNSYSYWLDPFEPLSSNDELSLKGSTLDSIILYVKKTAIPRANPIQPQPFTHSASSKQFARSPVGMKAASNGGMHSNLLKKNKKVISSAAPFTAFVAPILDPVNTIGSLPAVPSGLITKNPNSRPLRDPSSIFDTFRHRGEPSLRVQNHLQIVFEPSSGQTVDSGIISLGKQNSMNLTQCSIRELFPDEVTGDAAKSLAMIQSSAFCSGDPVPDGVYFGPFSTNILPKASICDDGTSIDLSAGIKLPMGVKVPKSMGIVDSKNDEWSPVEDLFLNQYAERFDQNWHAVSQALTHKSRVSTCQDTANVMNPVRSSKHCKIRWDKINGFASCTNEDKAADSTGASGHIEETQSTLMQESCNGILIDRRKVADANHLPARDSSGIGGILNRSRKLKNARMKTHLVPLTIPGYTTGANMQIVSSHLSHSQSVQEAIAVAARPSGIVPPRAEMWPLQFLDLTEKQQQEVDKKKKAASAGPTQVHGSQQGATMRNSHSNPRQAAPNPAAQRIPSHPISGQRQPTSAIPRAPQQPVQGTTYARPTNQPGPPRLPHNPPSNTNSNR